MSKKQLKIECQSESGTLNKPDLIDLGKQIIVAMIVTLCLILVEQIPNVDFGLATIYIVPCLMIIVTSILKYVQGPKRS